jgi:hypothetical protein
VLAPQTPARIPIIALVLNSLLTYTGNVFEYKTLLFFQTSSEVFMKKKSSLLILANALLLHTIPAWAGNIIPHGNGTWIYDITYDKDGTKLKPVAGLFYNTLAQYNKGATAGSQLDHLFYYGGGIEMYCSSSLQNCTPNSFLVSYFEPQQINSKKNNWDFWTQSLGDSGFSSGQAYQKLVGAKQNIPVLDGRVDVIDPDGDYLNHLNDASEIDAAHFADKVAKSVCADDNIDGVQFDIEPFSFTGDKGVFSGQGQQYFYQQIAKDFAGYYDGKPSSTKDADGINHLTVDPLRCVDAAHPNGRYFSVFTFGGAVTPQVVAAFTQHGNGYIVDSLYDLANTPGGTLTSPQQFSQLIKDEIIAMKSKGVPYQFAIPAAASAHEFEMKNGKPTGYQQLQYVSTALNAIKAAGVIEDPNFKGIDVWAWNQQMWWNGTQFSPATPPAAEGDDVFHYLQQHLNLANLT